LPLLSDFIYVAASVGRIAPFFVLVNEEATAPNPQQTNNMKEF
jgi:hypothetical protein